MIDIVVKEGEEEDVQKWGLIDEMYNPKPGDIVYLSGNPKFGGTYRVVAISEVYNIALIRPQYYPQYFVAQFNREMRMLVVEFISETTPLVVRGVWAFAQDFALLR